MNAGERTEKFSEKYILDMVKKFFPMYNDVKHLNVLLWK